MSTPNLQQTEAFDRRFLAFLAVMIIMLVMLYLFAVTFVPLSTNGGKYADIAVPMLLATGLGSLVGYFFGASKSNNSKPADPAPPALMPVTVPVTITATADGEVKGTEEPKT